MWSCVQTDKCRGKFLPHAGRLRRRINFFVNGSGHPPCHDDLRTLIFHLRGALLGADPKQQRYVLRTLLAIFGYVGGCVIMEVGRVHGLADADKVRLYDGIALLATVGWYFVVRFGLANRSADPALTLWQMVFASSFATFAYSQFPEMRGALMCVQLAVVVFGTFNLRQRALWGFCMYVLVSMGGVMFFMSHHDPHRFPRGAEWVHFMILLMLQPSLVVLGSQFSALRQQLMRHRKELQAAVLRIQELASRDVLTGLYNRRHALEMLDHLLKRQARAITPCALVLIDLDHFKQVNDRYGHAVGDEVLKCFARQAQEVLRGSELIARWGGEEFLLVLPDTSQEGALVALERLRSGLAQVEVVAGVSELRVGFSGGVTLLCAGEPPLQAIHRADLALYEAKNAGRGRDVVRTENVST